MPVARSFFHRLGAVLRHPVVLALSLVSGAACGLVLPAANLALGVVTVLYLNLVHMVALPLVVAALLLGFRQLLALPGGGRRLVAFAVLSLGAMAVAATAAALLAMTMNLGAGLSQTHLGALGQLAMTTQAGDRLERYAPAVALTAAGVDAPSRWVPDSFMGALASGAPAAVLVACLAFGAALAVQPPPGSRVMFGQLETVYRACEGLIHRFNLALPVVGFALAATAVSHVGGAHLALMAPFMGTLALFVLLVAVGAIGLLSAHVGRPAWQVATALREPLTLGFFSGTSYAAVPGLIDGLSARLGLRRGLVEFIVPVAPLFLRVGEAAYFAMLTIFLANLYGRGVTAAELPLLLALSVAAAWLSIGQPAARLVALASMISIPLELPLDGVLPAVLIVDVLCAGARQVISLLACCALVVLVSRGLSGEEVAVANEAALPVQSLQLQLSRRELAAAGGLAFVASVLTGLIGLGVGLRRATPSRRKKP